MTYFEFFSKYSDMLYYLTFLLGITNISYNFFEYLSYSHKYDSSQLSKMEGRIHMRLNDIDNKINMLYKLKLCETSDLDENKVETDNSDCESVIEDEVIYNDDEKSDYEIEDTDSNDNVSVSYNNEELETIEEVEELEEPEENVCVDQNDINDYYKDKIIKDKQSNSLSLSGIFRGWY